MVRQQEMNRLESSGWLTNGPLRDLLARAGLASPAEVVGAGLSEAQWVRAGEKIDRLRERFGGCRFAEEVEYGLLVVPAPEYLDTRGAVPHEVRRGQHPALVEDFVDPALGPGAATVTVSAAFLGSPAPAALDAALEKLKDRGILVGKNGLARNVMAFQPPLVITAADVDHLLNQLEDVLREIKE